MVVDDIENALQVVTDDAICRRRSAEEMDDLMARRTQTRDSLFVKTFVVVYKELQIFSALLLRMITAQISVCKEISN